MLAGHLGAQVTAQMLDWADTWHRGDGSTVTCQGASTPYTRADNPPRASPDCGTCTSSSTGQPGGAFQATATITWDITWRGSAGRVGCCRC